MDFLAEGDADVGCASLDFLSIPPYAHEFLDLRELKMLLPSLTVVG
jgi:hypothetical protein